MLETGFSQSAVLHTARCLTSLQMPLYVAAGYSRCKVLSASPKFCHGQHFPFKAIPDRHNLSSADVSRRASEFDTCWKSTNEERPPRPHSVKKKNFREQRFAQKHEKIRTWILGGLPEQILQACKSLCFSTFLGGLIMLLVQSDAAIAETAIVNIPDIDNELELLPIPKNFGTLKDLPLPSYEKVILPNGLHVFLLEDHELGLVGGQLLARGGSKFDPSDKIGLATISSIVQRSGGTTQHPAEDLDVKLEEMAARIESSSSVSQMSVGFRCVSEDLAKVMPLFFEVIQTPLMPKDKLELARIQLLSSIKSRGDNPDGIASREFLKILYGDKSAYSRYFTEDSLNSIKQEDLVAFHKAVFSPKTSVLGIWGDFNRKMVKDIILRNLNHWDTDSGMESNLYRYREAETSLRDLESGISEYESNKIYVVDKPGLNQGFVRIGELGTTIADPDVFSLDALNGILNGFGGLLFDQVRSKEGLAYSVYGGWTPAVEHRGSFLAGGQTQITTVPQFIESIRNVLQNVTEQVPSEEALNRAKESIINSFVFNFADSGVQLSRIMTYDLFGIDQNFIFDYRRKVAGLTGTDILEAARRRLHPGLQPIIVVADASKIVSSLRTLGKAIVMLHPDYLP